MKKTRKVSTKFRDKRPSSRKQKITSAKAIEIIERRYQIVALKRDGHTTKEISNLLNLSTSMVADELTEVLNNTIIKYQETTEQMRQIQLDQLDQIIKAYTKVGANTTQRMVEIDGREVLITEPPDPAAARILLDAIRSKSKLMALDMPETKKLELTGIREYRGVDMEKV